MCDASVGPMTSPGPILFLGAPGVGKGTQARRVARLWGIPHISTGELLRANVSQRTPLGKAAQEIIDNGALVSDDIVNEMVEVRLAEADCEHGYILDGFPRTLTQAVWLDRCLSSGSVQPPIVGIKIHLSEGELLLRISGRRSCPVCHTAYNVYFNPPTREKYCDRGCAELIHRSDDYEETVGKRLRVYEQRTAPVIAHYSSLGYLAEVNGSQAVETVAAGIVAAVGRLRGLASPIFGSHLTIQR